MPINKHAPGCNCCGCPLFSDSFDRADSETIGNGWFTGGFPTPDWDIASETLTQGTTTANAFALSGDLGDPGPMSWRLKGKGPLFHAPPTQAKSCGRRGCCKR